MTRFVSFPSPPGALSGMRFVSLRSILTFLLAGHFLTGVLGCGEKNPVRSDVPDPGSASRPDAAYDLSQEPLDWLLENGHPLTSLTSDDFSDLEFLKEVIGEKRIVQLGESGHGVAEFDQAKVRLIRFLHQEMGFNLLAFESSIFDCYWADLMADEMTAREMMRASIFPVWWTLETLPLFDYLKETRATDHPLTLAGFDIQHSGNARLERAGFLAEVVGRLDPAYGQQVRNTIERFDLYWSPPESLEPFYLELLDFFDTRKEEFLAAYSDDPVTPRIARQMAWSALRLIEYARAGKGSEIRDRAMAGNLIKVATEVFPSSRIIVWAHNYHIRYNGTATDGQPNMGERIWSFFGLRDGIYSVGLYMYEGSAALNDGRIYTIEPARPEFLEGYLARAGTPFLFVDFFKDDPARAAGWMEKEIPTRTWGAIQINLVPADQYDAVLFIRTVRPPTFRLAPAPG